jgi:hypothetical protein
MSATQLDLSAIIVAASARVEVIVERQGRPRLHTRRAARVVTASL